MADLSVDLTTCFGNADGDLKSPHAGMCAPLHTAGSPEPGSSTASELDDFELSYLHEMFQTETLLAPGDEGVLLEQPASAKLAVQPDSGAQAPLEESWVGILNVTEADDAAASTHTTCSPDGSDALEVCEDVTLDEKRITSVDMLTPGEMSCAGTPATVDAMLGQKRKAEVEFPPVGAPRTVGNATAGTVGAQEMLGTGSASAVTASGVVLPSPSAAAQHRFTSAELEKLDLETTRANDIVAALMARDPTTLSPEEVKLMKKHKRLIKNRESAQLSRQRKKNHLETLEAQVQQLEKERASLTARMDRLMEENAFLKKQLIAQGKPIYSAPVHPPPPLCSAAAAAAAAAAANASKANVAMPVMLPGGHMAPAAGVAHAMPAASQPPPPAAPAKYAAAPAAAPTAPAAAPTAPAAAAPAKKTCSMAPATPPVDKTVRGSALLAVCLFAGMFFTSVDLFQERLPQLYTVPGAVDIPRSFDAPADAVPRRAGRVLLAATASSDAPPRWTEDGEGGGRARDRGDVLDRGAVLVVTLLDNLVNQLGSHASPALFGRLCRKLVEMQVLRAPCDLLAEDGGLDAVRVKYMEEFAELNDVFLKDLDKVRMDAEFTFSTPRKDGAAQGPGYALAKGIASAPPRPPTMPLPGRVPGLQGMGMREEGVKGVKQWQMEQWEALGIEELLKHRSVVEREKGAEKVEGSGVGNKWHMLCPDAQMLLIADKPANADMSIAARLSRKQRSAAKLGLGLGAEGGAGGAAGRSRGLLNNSSSTEPEGGGGTEGGDGVHIPGDSAGSAGQRPLSMILPRRVLSDGLGGRFAEMLPEEPSPLVEVQCKSFDLVPLFPPPAAVRSAAVATVS